MPLIPFVFFGKYKDLHKAKRSLTAQYLTKKLVIEVPKVRRQLRNKIVIEGAKENNLKNITVGIPLNGLVCVSGVSGSGKSTLIKQVFAPALQKHLGLSSNKIGNFNKLSGDVDSIDKQIESLKESQHLVQISNKYQLNSLSDFVDCVVSTRLCQKSAQIMGFSNAIVSRYS